VNPSPAVGSFASQAPNLGNVPPLTGCAHKAHNLDTQCKFDYTQSLQIPEVYDTKNH
jgi:hypothetical protein